MIWLAAAFFIFAKGKNFFFFVIEKHVDRRAFWPIFMKWGKKFKGESEEAS